MRGYGNLETVPHGRVERCKMRANLATPEPRPYLIIVRKGPTWDPKDFEALCRLLSERFDGELWAYGSYDADLLFDRIRLRAVKGHPTRHTLNLARFAWHFFR